MATLPKPVQSQREYAAAAKRQKLQNTISSNSTPSTSTTQTSQKNDYHYEMMTGTWVGSGSHHRPQQENVSQTQNQNVQPYYLQLLAATCAGEVNNNNNLVASTSGSATATGSSGTVGAGTQGVASGKESSRLCQPAVGVAAVAASCKACHPQGFLQPQQRAAVQQPWPGVTAPAVASGGGRHRGRAVEPGPEHAATSSAVNRRQAAAAAGALPWARATKRSRVSTPATATATATAPWPPACCKACQQWNQDNSRVLWNNDNMLRLFQV